MPAHRLHSWTLLALAALAPMAAALEPFNPTEANSWAFPTENPDPSAASPIDLRHLNDEVAGADGWLKLSRDGNSFVHPDGRVMRFLGTHMANGVRYGNARRKSRDDWTMADYHTHARWLARLGINSVRLGNVAIHDPSPDAAPEKLDPVMVEGIFRRIAAARGAGIYCQLSPVWFHGVKDIGRKLEIEGYADGKKDLTKLLWFHPGLQRVYKAWLRELYTTKNPHTGLSIAEDPAVFALEICNEDSLWWYGTGRLVGGPRRMLHEKFGRWAAKRYGSAAGAIKAWGASAQSEDDPDKGRLAVVQMWFLTREGRASGQVPIKRINDQVRFLIETQKAFHAEMKRYLREELGCGQLISSSNFRSVDTVITEDALRLSCAEMDLICKNNYFGSGGKQDTPGWRLDAGDIMGLTSAVTRPLELPIRMRQVEGKPFMITETLWPRMHPFEVEGPIVLAAYQAMLGLDGIYWAGPRDRTWSRDPYRRFWTHKGSHPMSVFDNASPGGMGQMPAAALLLRAAGLEKAPTVLHERRTPEEIVTGELPLTAEAGYHDFVHAEEGEMTEEGRAKVPAEVFLTGRVAVEYVAKDRPDSVEPIDKHLQGREIHSATDELTMDRGRKLFTVDAPRAQVACGFLAQAGPVELSDVTFTSGNEYAALAMVSLDDKPLADSGRILLQIGLPSRPTGWRESRTTFQADGESRPGLLVEKTGKMPWRVRNTRLRVELANGGISVATLLDGNGMPDRKLAIEKTEAGVRLVCPPESMYIVLSGR